MQPFFGSQKRAKSHLAAVPYQEMPNFMGELRSRASTSARALEFCILTAARSGEVRGVYMGRNRLCRKAVGRPCGADEGKAATSSPADKCRSRTSEKASARQAIRFDFRG